MIINKQILTQFICVLKKCISLTNFNILYLLSLKLIIRQIYDYSFVYFNKNCGKKVSILKIIVVYACARSLY